MPARHASLLLLGFAACGQKPADPPTPAPAPAPDAAPAAPAPAATSGFTYDAATGTCKDANGAEGRNKADPAVLFANFDEPNNKYVGVNAECVDFSGFDFGAHIGVSYRALDGWNLRGAKFMGAKFVFANINGADLAGADLRDFSFGYATIDGKGDAFTHVDDSCELGEGYKVFCMR